MKKRGPGVGQAEMPVAELATVSGGLTASRKRHPQQPDYSIGLVRRPLHNWLGLFGFQHLGLEIKRPRHGVSTAQLLEDEKRPKESSAFLTPGAMDPSQRYLGLHVYSQGAFEKKAQCIEDNVKAFNRHGPKPYFMYGGPNSASFIHEVDKRCQLGFGDKFSVKNDFGYWYYNLHPGAFGR